MRSRRRRLVWIGVAAVLVLGLAWGSVEAGWAWYKAARAAGQVTGGDPDHAPALMRTYGCAGCHAIPGVRAPRGQAGPPLSGMAQRAYVAGVLPNTPENLVSFIRDPRAHKPGTAMPVTGIDERGARDVAAYLYAW